MSLVTDPKAKLRYQHLITNSFVEVSSSRNQSKVTTHHTCLQCNRLLRWCPKPECSHAVKVHYVDCQPVRCSCSTLFCFVCGENWHEPVKCDLLRKWRKKCDDDSETSNWIAANTKECPKCNVTIEKDGLVVIDVSINIWRRDALADATTWSARIKTVNPTFVGYV